MHDNPAVKLGCTDCHGGDARVIPPRGLARLELEYTQLRDQAHVLPRYPEEWGYPKSAKPQRSYTLLNRESPAFIRFVNPGDYRVATQACGACHLTIIAAAQRSLMATGAMFFGGASYNNGVLPFKRYILGEAFTSRLNNNLREVHGYAYGAGSRFDMRMSAGGFYASAGVQTDKTADALVARLKPRVEALKVGLPTDAEAAYGPLVTSAHRKKVLDYIDFGVKEGAELVVDGRGFKMQGYENGFYLGGSLFDRVTPNMKTYQEEIFGPVLQIARARNFTEALALPSGHQYGNGVAIFTRDGDAAREFAARVNVGMVGINVPIPVPLAYYSFGGWKRSAFGDMNQHGPDGVRFYTRVKTVTGRWPKGDRENPSFVIPTMR